MAKKHGKIEIKGVDKMNSEKIHFVTNFIYNMSMKEKQVEIDRIEDSELLHVIMFNYNWDDGFEFPRLVLKNAKCEMSTALLTFYLAGGEEFLFEREQFLNRNSERITFISELYDDILSNVYPKGKIYFEPPLTKVEVYKLKKILTDSESIFIETFGDEKVELNV